MNGNRELDADIAIIGLGAMGSMAMWRLAERSANVIAFEQFEPAHDRGSSHGESRVTRTAYMEGPEYVPLVQRSSELFRELERVSGKSLLTMTGGLMIGPPEGEAVAGTLESAREHGLAHELLDAAELGRRYPQHRLNPGDLAVYEGPAGFLLPEAAVLAAVKRAEALGVRPHLNTRVEHIEEQDGIVTITTADGEYRARHVIVSVGPWLGAFLPELRLPVEIARQVLMWFPVEHPEAFRPDRFPIFIHEIEGARMRYGFPTLDGRTVKIVVHQEGELTTADTIDRSVRGSDLEPLADFVTKYLVGVEPRAVRSQVCMYTNTPDHDFLIGMPPGISWMTVLGGFSGHGFKFASVVGDIAADLATTGKTDYAITLFDLARFITAPELPG